MLFRIYRKIYKTIASFNRRNIQKANMNRLSNSRFTIISQNCFGGKIYHDLNQKFYSPTINLYIEGEDFIKLLEDLDYYVNSELEEAISNHKEYPVGVLGNSHRMIKIFFLHYKSFDEAKTKWNERKGRINRDNMYVIAMERDGMNEELIRRFDKLPYKKVIFTHKKYKDCKSQCYISKFKYDEYVGGADVFWDFISLNGKCLFEEYFDVVNFLNS